MRLIKLPEVLKKTSLSRTSILGLVNKKLFPKPVTTIGRSRAWVEAEVDEWIEERIAERDGVKGE